MAQSKSTKRFQDSLFTFSLSNPKSWQPGSLPVHTPLRKVMNLFHPGPELAFFHLIFIMVKTFYVRRVIYKDFVELESVSHKILRTGFCDLTLD